MAKGSGLTNPNVFNEVSNKDPNKPDISGADMYYSYDEVMKVHLQESGEMVSTPNSEASHDVYGGPASGEPNPGGWGGKGGK